MRVMIAALVALAAFFETVAAANARAQVDINLASQRMHVTSSEGDYTWRVSTARSGYHTPKGSYAPLRMERMHYSREYHMTPMPYAIFFKGGYAIHGSLNTRSLGRPVSHGCVRLSPAHAARLYQIVKDEGALISVTGKPPHSRG